MLTQEQIEKVLKLFAMGREGEVCREDEAVIVIRKVERLQTYAELFDLIMKEVVILELINGELAVAWNSSGMEDDGDPIVRKNRVN